MSEERMLHIVCGCEKCDEHAAAAIAAEREECALIADAAVEAIVDSDGAYNDDARMCAASIAELIRARGGK